MVRYPALVLLWQNVTQMGVEVTIQNTLEYHSISRICSCHLSHWEFLVPAGALWVQNICCSSIRKGVWEQQWAIVEQGGYFLDWCTASNLMTAGSKGCFCTRRQVHMSLVSWPNFATTEGTWMACSGSQETSAELWSWEYFCELIQNQLEEIQKMHLPCDNMW